MKQHDESGLTIAAAVGPDFSCVHGLVPYPVFPQPSLAGGGSRVFRVVAVHAPRPRAARPGRSSWVRT